MSNNNPRYQRYRRFNLTHLGSKFRAFFTGRGTALAASASAFSVSATIASNGLTVTGHGRTVGDGPFRFSAVTGTLAGVSTAVDYWVSAVVDANTIRVSPFYDLRSDLTVTAGVGTATLTRRTGGDALMLSSRRKGLERVRAATDIDNV